MTTDSATPPTIDDYIAGFAPNIQERLEQIRATIRAAAPDATEAIKYQMPTFVLAGNLVHFAAFKRHIGFYSTPAHPPPAVRDEMAVYAGPKGSLKFPYDQPVPLDLIGRMVKLRVGENLEWAAAKMKQK